jgi:subtilisin family serine protease
MSLAGHLPCPTGTQAAADYAWSKGTVIVAAAGNRAISGAEAPANCQNVIGVAATDSNDALAWFSDWGPEVDVAAPGDSVFSTVNPQNNSGAYYASRSGTSMASPHTAGVVALIWSTSYGTAPAAVRDRLFATADRTSGTGTKWTYGRINAANAVRSTQSPAPSPTASPTPSPTASPTPSPSPSPTPSPTPSPIPSPTVSPTPSPALPAAPSNLLAEAQPNGIRLSWTASTTSGVAYNVYRSTAPGGSKQQTATGVTNTRYNDRNGLVAGQLQCYQVTAQGAAGESPRSNEVCATAR